jgi:tetratricopeptide (TPR) repeat protein
MQYRFTAPGRTPSPAPANAARASGEEDDERASVTGEAFAAHLRLAERHLRSGRSLEALRCADRALALDLESATGWFAFARALRAIGERVHAAAALERAVQLEPTLAAAHAMLGCLHDELERPLLAEQSWLRALRFDPADKVSHVNLSSLYCRADQFELGREHASRALALDPALVGAHQNLAGLFAKIGRDADAQRHRDLAYRGRDLIVIPNPRARRRVLTLASAGWGNSPDRYLLPSDLYERLIWFIEYASDTQMRAPPPHDVVFNAIGDPDAAEPIAARVDQFLRQQTRRVLNPPDRIALTARHRARKLFAEIDGVEIPACVRVDAEQASESGVAAAVAGARLAAPWLIRPIGSHGGEGLKLIERLDDLAGFAASGPLYLSAFHDFRSTDGLYRKYRVFFVDRRPYPYHLAIGSHWLLHYASAGMVGHNERLAEERRFLEDPEGALGTRAMDALRAIGRRMDLDFAGLDFSVTRDGRVLLFEANATMLVHPESPDGPLAHKQSHIDQILRAFWELVERS